MLPVIEHRSLLDCLPLFLRPLQRKRPRVEPLAVAKFLVLPELRLDSVVTVIAQLDQEPIVPTEELEESLARSLA